MTKEILSARLRNACAEIRRTPMKISDLIPMLQESADALDKLQPAEAHSAQQSWELHIEQAGAIRELLDLHAPQNEGNLQTRLAQVFAQPVHMTDQIEAMQADVARINWLTASKESHGFCYVVGSGECRYYAHQFDGFSSVREIIDAAMKEPK